MFVAGAIVLACQKFAFLHQHLEAKSLQTQMPKVSVKYCLNFFLLIGLKSLVSASASAFSN
jgi:hypothetical protein